MNHMLLFLPKKQGRDFDIIQESLGKVTLESIKYGYYLKIILLYEPKYFTGKMYLQYYLVSISHIPQRIIDKFDQVTRSFIENGLHEFLMSFATFSIRIWSGIDHSKVEQNFQPITFDEFYYFLVLCFYYLLFSIFVCIFEIIWFSIQQNYHISWP